MRKKYFANQAKTLISTPTALLKPTRPTTPDKIENRFILLYSLNPQIILILHRLLYLLSILLEVVGRVGFRSVVGVEISIFA